MNDAEMMELPVDREVGAALEDKTGEALKAMLAERSDRVIAGMARRLTTLVAQRDRYQRQLEQMAAETETALEPIVRQITQLAEALESLALAERTESNGKVKALHVPGLGSIRTRESGGRPSVTDTDALVHFLSGSERETYLVPQEPKVDARAVLADLPAIAAAHGIEAGGEDGSPVYKIPGVTYGDVVVKGKPDWIEL